MTRTWGGRSPAPLNSSRLQEQVTRGPTPCSRPSVNPGMLQKPTTPRAQQAQVSFTTGITSRQAASLQVRQTMFWFSKQNGGGDGEGSRVLATCDPAVGLVSLTQSSRSSWATRTPSPRSGPHQTTKLLPTPEQSTGLGIHSSEPNSNLHGLCSAAYASPSPQLLRPADTAVLPVCWPRRTRPRAERPPRKSPARNPGKRVLTI